MVFIGTASDEMYVIRIEPWKFGIRPLRREAKIDELLTDLQRRCVSKIYDFFGLSASLMAYMGDSIDSISGLSTDQRCAMSSSRLVTPIHDRHRLMEVLCLIPEHGDLRASNFTFRLRRSSFCRLMTPGEISMLNSAGMLPKYKLRQPLTLQKLG